MTKEKQATKGSQADYEQRIGELTELLQRVQADFENYKKHVEKQQTHNRERAKAEVIFQLLPITDSFELALKNTEKHEDLVKGVELIYSQLFSSLENLGLKQITTEKFDPYKHEVLMQQESDEAEGTILEILQKGYMLNDMVLRTSKVKTAKNVKKDVKETNTTK